MAGSLAAVSSEMPRVHDVVPLLDVDGVAEALTTHLQSTGSGGLYCPCAAPTQGHMSSGLGFIVRIGGIELPVSARRMQRCLGCQWVVMACQLLLAIWLVVAMWTGLTGLI